MMNHKPSIRRATPDDVSLIVDIGARTFETSFGADNSQEDMKQYLSMNFSKALIAAQLSDRSSIFLLAHDACKVVGYAMLRVSPRPVAVTGSKPVELVRIYVEEEVIGKGYGEALMKSCLEEAKSNGHRFIWLGVWEKNLRAIRFYEKWGFTEVGTKKFALGSDLQNDRIMARPINMIA